MIDRDDIKKIEEAVNEFFSKMTITASKIAVDFSFDTVDLNVVLEEPQIIIGEKGQTLFEIQRLLRVLLNKKLQKIFYLNFDINDYKKKKIEYLKEMARDLANEVALSKEEKVLFPMPAYERRIIHSELSQRQDITTESQGEGPDRRVVIRPK